MYVSLFLLIVFFTTSNTGKRTCTADVQPYMLIASYFITMHVRLLKITTFKALSALTGDKSDYSSIGSAYGSKEHDSHESGALRQMMSS